MKRDPQAEAMFNATRGTGKRLTLEGIEGFVALLLSDSHLDRRDAERIMQHFDTAFGMKKRPTDDEVNTTIALAVGFTRKDQYVPGADFQPVSNLGQALEAAAALRTILNDSLIGKWAEGFAEDVWQGLEPAATAARGLSKRLYARVKEQDADS